MTHAGARESYIVVINDDDTFLQLMQDLLIEEGYEVQTRRDAERAYEFVKSERPDLVILDLVIGREEIGWRILELLTLDPETRSIPVVICSAAVRSLQEHELLLRKYGVRALPKPFDLDDLLSTIQAALLDQRRRMRERFALQPVEADGKTAAVAAAPSQ